MQNENLTFFVEINESDYVFVAGFYDENKKLKVIEKIITPIKGIYKRKFTNIEESISVIKKNIELIENRLNYIFKDLILVIDNFDYYCLNISGFKKLNGSQVLKENISYILNLLKQSVIENEKQKTILHIFNSKSVLDGVNIKNLPIGLFGNFYNHELTFFLIDNNNLKNINLIFNKCNLKVKKIILKSFSEGSQLINKNDTENFFKLKINKKNSNLSFFDQASFRYSENFNFGTDIIFNDISKICSIDYDTIVNFLSNYYADDKKNSDESEFLEASYFKNKIYRKIRKKLIINIIDARIEEIIDIIFNKNINIKSFKKNNLKMYLVIKDKIIFNKFQVSFTSCCLKTTNINPVFINDLDLDSSIENVANLSAFGWKKEAIPIIQKKSSLIARVFKSIFG